MGVTGPHRDLGPQHRVVFTRCSAAVGGGPVGAAQWSPRCSLTVGRGLAQGASVPVATWSQRQPQRLGKSRKDPAQWPQSHAPWVPSSDTGSGGQITEVPQAGLPQRTTPLLIPPSSLAVPARSTHTHPVLSHAHGAFSLEEDWVRPSPLSPPLWPLSWWRQAGPMCSVSCGGSTASGVPHSVWAPRGDPKVTSLALCPGYTSLAGCAAWKAVGRQQAPDTPAARRPSGGASVGSRHGAPRKAGAPATLSILQTGSQGLKGRLEDLGSPSGGGQQQDVPRTLLSHSERRVLLPDVHGQGVQVQGHPDVGGRAQRPAGARAGHAHSFHA